MAIIGQAFPYTPIANPSHFTTGWTFGIQERELREKVTRCAPQAQVVVLLSHNGADTDIKLLRGLRASMPFWVVTPMTRFPARWKLKTRGMTLVTNAGSNGKFLGVLDFDVRDGRIRDWSYRLLPVFAELLPLTRR